MKKIFYLSVVLLLSCLAVFISPKTGMANADENDSDINSAYIVTAAGAKDGDGFVCAYYKNGKITSLSFDLLKGVTTEYFGVICADNSGDVESYQTAVNFAAFGIGGSVRSSSGATVSADLVLAGGKNYKFTFDGSSVRVFSRGYYDTEYVDAAVITFPSKRSGVYGVCAISDKEKSASCIIDNLTMYDSQGNTIFYNKFNYSNIGDKGTLKTYADRSGYAEKFNNQTFTVVFLNEEGDLISKQNVCEYNYATPPAAPVKKGFRFEGWSGEYTSVRSDVAFYPVYSSNGGKTGCKGALSDSAIGLILPFFAVLGHFFTKRRIEV